MKKFKRIMALVIAVIMVLAMTTAAWADGPTHQDPEKGSITVKSPIMGAAYTGYRIFDLTISESGDSIAYTIDTNSPFYQAVVDYAEATKTTTTEGEETVTKYALTLSELTTQTETDTNGDVTYAKYAISVNTDPAKGPVFDAQHFGQAMQKAINGTPAVEDDPATPGDETQAAVDPITVGDDYKIYPDYTDTEAKVVTLPDTDQITFKNIPLGYYLITNEYPTEERTATFTVPAYTDDSGTHEAVEYKFNKDTTNEKIEAAAQAYVDATIDEDAVNAYIEENNLKDKLVPAGRDLTEDEWNSVKTQLESSTKQKTIESIRKTLEEIKQNAADINVKEPVLVFVDSTTKSAEIFEKNELDKWDVPVNPDLGEADLEDLPEFGEPDGGKNIIVGYKEETVTDPETQEETVVKKPIYADWTEANIGDTVHYELRVNAMNFVREDEELGEGETIDNNSEFNVKQVKEYIIGDYQNDSLTFDPEKDKIKVRIVDDNGDTVVLNEVPQEWDYTEWHEKFFLSADKALDDNGAVKEDILENGGGIAIPWALKTTDETEAKKHKNVTSYELVTTEDDPDTEENEEVKTTYYWYSIYDSDVTIVVDYTMTLTDKATIDMPGNINYSEYGVNYTDKDENDYTPPTPENPEDREKPDKDSKKDTATVYTYALAIQKVDENGEKLAGATFKIQGLTANELEEGYYKVVSYVGDKVKDADGNPTDEDTEDSIELKSDKNGLLVIEGFMSSAELTVKEVVAPDGYNILTAPVTMKPIKVGEEVTTTAETTNYKYKVDDDGNEIPGTREETSSEASSTREKKYFDASGKVVASVVTTADGKTTYYIDAAGEMTVATEQQFNTKVAELSVTPADDKERLDTDSLVDSSKLSPLAVQVENKKGQELPSTGGIGTTIFYVVGAILVIGAGVILITRRRMDA